MEYSTTIFYDCAKYLIVCRFCLSFRSSYACLAFRFLHPLTELEIRLPFCEFRVLFRVQTFLFFGDGLVRLPGFPHVAGWAGCARE